MNVKNYVTSIIYFVCLAVSIVEAMERAYSSEQISFFQDDKYTISDEALYEAEFLLSQKENDFEEILQKPSETPTNQVHVNMFACSDVVKPQFNIIENVTYLCGKEYNNQTDRNNCVKRHKFLCPCCCTRYKTARLRDKCVVTHISNGADSHEITNKIQSLARCGVCESEFMGNRVAWEHEKLCKNKGQQLSEDQNIKVITASNNNVSRFKYHCVCKRKYNGAYRRGLSVRGL
jgi:hypothetical protein